MRQSRGQFVWLVLAVATSPLRAQVSGGDTDHDIDTDLNDLKKLVTCLGGPQSDVATECVDANLDRTGDVDLFDFAALQTVVRQ